jgi:hypothetical protein
MRWGILVALIGLSAISYAEEPRASIAGYTLGMTIEQAKAVPVVAANQIKIGRGYEPPSKGHFECVGDKKASANLRSDRFMAQVGIIECGAHNSSNFMDYQVLGDGLVAAVEYRFYDNALYKVAATFKQRNLETVKDSLDAKFGPASQVEDGQVQNRMGASFASIRLTWNTGGDEIVLESPGRRVDDFTVTLRQRDLDDRLTAQIKAARAAASGL